MRLLLSNVSLELLEPLELCISHVMTLIVHTLQ